MLVSLWSHWGVVVRRIPFSSFVKEKRQPKRNWKLTYSTWGCSSFQRKKTCFIFVHQSRLCHLALWHHCVLTRFQRGEGFMKNEFLHFEKKNNFGSCKCRWWQIFLLFPLLSITNLAYFKRLSVCGWAMTVVARVLPWAFFFTALVTSYLTGAYYSTTDLRTGCFCTNVLWKMTNGWRWVW